MQGYSTSRDGQEQEQRPILICTCPSGRVQWKLLYPYEYSSKKPRRRGSGDQEASAARRM